MLKKLSTAAEEADQHVKQLHDLNERIGFFLFILNN
jgi:hypothetical protein